jgi:vitamin B12 transporter
MRRIDLAMLLLASTIFTPAFAASARAADPAPDPSLPDVVVTATRIPTPVVDIPAGVTVIDRQTIEAQGYVTLVDALAAVPGLRVSQSGGPGGNASVFMRGTDSNHVLVLRDGMPLNDASDSSGAFNFGVDTLSDIERIEVIRGPMAALYGSGAIGGVINLISRRGTEPGPHIEAELSGGYPAQVAGSVVASGIQGPVDYAMTAESQSQQGFDTTPQRMSIYTNTPQGFRDRVGSLNLGYTPTEGTRLSLFLRARTAIFGFNALGSPTFDDANSTGRADSLLGRVGVTSKLFGGAYETGLFVGRLQDDRHYTELLNALDPNQATNDSRYHAYRTDVQWNNTVHLDDVLALGHGAFSGTDLTFGYEHVSDMVNVKVASSGIYGPYSDNALAHMDTDAGYAGLKTTLWDRLTLTGQMRQDAVIDQMPFTWRTGAVLDVKEIATHFKAAYGTAFRAPSLFDRYGVDSYGYVGNPTLRPERSEGWEAGFTTDLLPMAGRNLASFGATWFDTRVRDLIVTAFTPVYTAVNAGSARMQGAELELTLRPLETLTLNAAYTFTDAQNLDTGERLLRRPQNTASFTALAKPLPGLTIAPELLFTGAYSDYLIGNDGSSVTDTYGNSVIGTSGQGLILNLTVTYEVMPGVTVFANGRNLTDSRFEPVNGYQTPGTSFLAGTRVRF